MAFLTIEGRGGKRGQARERAGTKAPQEEGNGRRRVTARGRECPRWCSLSVPYDEARGRGTPGGVAAPGGDAPPPWGSPRVPSGEARGSSTPGGVAASRVSAAAIQAQSRTAFSTLG